MPTLGQDDICTSTPGIRRSTLLVQKDMTTQDKAVVVPVLKAEQLLIT